MKNKTTTLLFLLLLTSLPAISQNKYFDLMVDGEYVNDSTFGGILAPAEFELKFKEPYTGMTVRKGMLVVLRYQKTDTIRFEGSIVRNENASPVRTFELIIEEIEDISNSRLEKVNIKEEFTTKNYTHNKARYHYINKSSISLYLNDELVNPSEDVSLTEENTWSFSSETLEIHSSEVILLRGKRPVGAPQLGKKTLNDTRFHTYVNSGDVLFFKFSNEQGEVVGSKVVFVK